jgi:hypothetical protein
MVGNTNRLGEPGVLQPVKAKWFNNGTEEALLAIDESGRPVNEDYSSWVKGKVSGKHPKVLQLKNERVESQSNG